MNFKKTKCVLLGVVAGLLNGFFGAGGGLIVVPMLQALGIEQKKAHATSISIILPLSIISAVMYYLKGVRLNLKGFSFIIIAGFIGCIIGSLLLKKIKGNVLRRIFAIIMIVSAVRIFLK